MKQGVDSRYAATLPYIVFLLLGFSLFPAAGRDDSHITFWAVHSLVEWGEILNYNGDRVEQSSSLLQTLLLWPLAELLPVSIVTLGYGFSIACGLLAIFLTGHYSGLAGVDRRVLQLLLAMTGPSLYWSYGGLETPITACAMLLFLMAWRNFRLRIGRNSALTLTAASFVYILVRPEAVFVLAAFYLGSMFLAVRKHNKLDAATAGLLIALTGFATLTAWRLWYFGDWFPQPVIAKVGIPTNLAERITDGFHYLYVSVLNFPVLAVLLLPVLSRGWRTLANPDHEDSIDAALLMILAQLAFTISSGGDWMPAGRFLAPVMPLAILVTWHELALLRRKTVAVGALATLLLGSLVWFAHFLSETYPIVQYRNYWQSYGKDRNAAAYSFFERANLPHLRDIAFLDRAQPLMVPFLSPEQDRTILSIQAGMVPYYLAQRFAGQLTFIDAVGLTTRDFSDCPPVMRWGRYRGGIDFDYELFFQQLEHLEDYCGITAPDFIFDLSHANWNSELPEILEREGYWILYRQQGVMNMVTFPRGRSVPMGEILAVKKRLIMELWLDAGP